MSKLALMTCRSPYIENEKIYPPLGLLYLKSAVEENTNFEVDLIDKYDFKNFDLSDYSHIGVSVMTPQRKESKRILKYIKTKYPKAKTIIGGPHAKHYFKEVFNEEWDYIVTSDGQRSLINILNGSAERVSIDNMNRKEWANQPRPDRTSKKARNFLKNYSYTLLGKKAGTMLTATGCPMKCTFCEESSTPIRWSKLETISQELDDLVGLGYEGVYLFDDLFAIAMPKIKPILKEIKKRNLIFRCNGQANYFTKWGEDFAKLLSESGCREIAFGHESGSQKILDNVNKRTTIEQNYLSVEYAKKHKIKVKSFLMLGLPGENYETLKQTENFIKTSGVDDFQLAIYYPYKGTIIRDKIDQNEDNFDLFFEGEGLGAYGQKGGNTESVIRTQTLSSEDLLDFRDYLINKYLPESHSKKWEDKFFDEWYPDREI